MINVTWGDREANDWEEQREFEKQKLKTKRYNKYDEAGITQTIVHNYTNKLKARQSRRITGNIPIVHWHMYCE